MVGHSPASRFVIRFAIVALLISCAAPSLAARPGALEHEGVNLHDWLEQLRSGSNQNQARTAVRAVGVDGLPLLHRYVEAKDSWIRKRSEKVLKTLGLGGTLPVSAVRKRHLANLGYDAFDGQVARQIIRRLDDEALLYSDDEPVYRYCRDLDLIGDEAIPELINALDDPSPYIRYHAAFCLGFFRDLQSPEAAPPLARLVKDEKWFVRVRALLALMSLRPDEAIAVPALSAGLSDERSTVRYTAARGLLHYAKEGATVNEVLQAAIDEMDSFPDVPSDRSLLGEKSREDIRDVLSEALQYSKQ